MLTGKTITKITIDALVGVILHTNEGDTFALVPDHMDALLPDVCHARNIIGHPVIGTSISRSASTDLDRTYTACFFCIKTHGGAGTIEFMYSSDRHEELRVMLCRLGDDRND